MSIDADTSRANDDWQEFISKFLGGVPSGLVTSETCIEGLVGADLLLNALVRQRLEVILHSPPPALVATIRTFGDAFEWWQVRRSDVTESPSSPEHVEKDAATPDSVGSPSFRAIGRRSELVPLSPDHLDFLYGHLRRPDVGFKWRTGGTTPTPEQFVRSLDEASFLNYAVVERRTGKLTGLVAAYNANFSDGTFHFGSVSTSEPGARSLTIAEGLFLLLEFCFFNWPFRKAYAEVPEYNWSNFASGEGVLYDVEGVLKDHEFLNGRYWDQKIVSVTRDKFKGFSDQWGDLLRAPSVGSTFKTPERGTSSTQQPHVKDRRPN